MPPGLTLHQYNQADLRRLNLELNRQNQTLASDADAVLASGSGAAAGGSHGNKARVHRVGVSQVGKSVGAAWGAVVRRLTRLATS